MNPFKLRLALSACCFALCISGGRVRGEDKAGDDPPPKKDDTIAKDWILFQEARQAISEYLTPNEVLVWLDILPKAEMGDHFETINPDRPDTHNAYGNPDSRVFHSVAGNATDGPEFETFGQRDGGGRRLMFPKRNAELSQAIMKCMHEGLDKKLAPALSDAQSKELAKAIRTLGADDYQERERGSKAIVELGAGCIATLVETLKTEHDAEVTARIAKLLLKLRLLAVLARFRADHPLPASAEEGKSKGGEPGNALPKK